MDTQFLLIENPGVVGSDLLTLVGASTARGNDQLIGQFGSGFKYGIALMMRKNVKLFVYLGNNGYSFELANRETHDAANRNIMLREVMMKQIAGTGRKTKGMGFTVDFGSVDWQDPSMAIREFVSNALDGCVLQKKDPRDSRVLWVEEDDIRAKAGFTRIYIEKSHDIEKAYRSIGKTFLVFDREWDTNVAIMEKREPGSGTRVYRKGVLVGEFTRRSMFDYNLNDIHLNESRVIDEYDARYSVSRVMMRADVPVLKQYIQKLVEGDTALFEMHLDGYHQRVRETDLNFETMKTHWVQAWKEVLGDTGVAVESMESAFMVQSKGYKGVIVSSGLFESLALFGIKTTTDVLDHFEVEGRKPFVMTAHQQSKCERIWDCLVRLGVTKDRHIPTIEGYSTVMDAGGTTKGYYDSERDVVGLSSDILSDEGFMFYKVVCEEFAHAITGAYDGTRDFQDYAFRVMGMLMQEAIGQ